MKKLFILSLFCLSMSLYAQTLPKVQKPAELATGPYSEGTDTKLTPADIQKFKPWAQSARKVLTKALEDAKIMPISERSSFIKSQVQGVVNRSGSKRYQTLMRYALNRGLLLVDELNQQADMSSIGTRENQLDILMKTIDVALSFYESDLEYQKRIESGDSVVEINNAQFGYALASRLMTAAINILDASAQYKVVYKTLEMFNWDLSQDRNARDYSETIWDIYNNLSRYSEQPNTNDFINIQNVRKLYYVWESNKNIGTLVDQSKYVIRSIDKKSNNSTSMGVRKDHEMKLILDKALKGELGACRMAIAEGNYQLYYKGEFKGNYSPYEGMKKINYYYNKGYCKLEDYNEGQNLIRILLKNDNLSSCYVRESDGYHQIYINGHFKGNYDKGNSPLQVQFYSECLSYRRN